MFVFNEEMKIAKTFLQAILLASAFTNSAIACRGPFPTFERATSLAEVIFLGKIIRVSEWKEDARSRPFKFALIDFQVKRSWKGSTSSKIQIRVDSHTCGIGTFMEKGQKWLILASGKPLSSGATSLSRRIFENDPESNQYDELKKLLGAGRSR